MDCIEVRAHPCRCRSCRSPFASWCASSCRRRARRSSCQPPSSQPGPCRQWTGDGGSGKDASNTVQRAETHLAARGGGLGRGLGSHFEVGDVVLNAVDEVDVLDVMDAVGW